MKEYLRREWYSRDDVMSNIVPLLRGREVAFMVPKVLRTERGNYPVRCIKAHHSSYLLNNMKAFSFFERKYNLYHSIFRLKNLPMFSYSPLKRSEQQHEFFLKYYDHVTGVDFVMDLDGKETFELSERVRAARDVVVKICAFMKSFGVPYRVEFSGSKGFHIEVDDVFRDFPATREWSKRTVVLEKIATLLVMKANGLRPQLPEDEESLAILKKELKDLYSFDSSIYNVTRIWKVPYSYDAASDMIVTPLSDEELINFKLEDFMVEKMLGKNLWNAGLKTREGNLTNFWRMAEYLGIDSWTVSGG